jgi:hypothetical protein
MSANRRLLTVQLLNDSHAGSIAYIPRIDLCPSDSEIPVPLRRRQFPVKLAFALTIHKAQGQSLKRTAIYLPQPVFSHGQLYVALSRSGIPENTQILIPNVAGKQGIFPGKIGVYTKNVVYQEALSL